MAQRFGHAVVHVAVVDVGELHLLRQEQLTVEDQIVHVVQYRRTCERLVDEPFGVEYKLGQECELLLWIYRIAQIEVLGQLVKYPIVKVAYETRLFVNVRR